MNARKFSAHMQRPTSNIDNFINNPPARFEPILRCRSIYNAAALLGGDIFSEWLERCVDSREIRMSGWELLLPISKEEAREIGLINYVFFDLHAFALRVSCQFPGNIVRLFLLDASISADFTAEIARLNSPLFGVFELRRPPDGAQLRRVLQYQNQIKSGAREMKQYEIDVGEEVVKAMFLDPRWQPDALEVMRVLFPVIDRLKCCRVAGFVRMPLFEARRLFTNLPAYPSQARSIQAQLLVQFTASRGAWILERYFTSRASIMGRECQIDEQDQIGLLELHFDPFGRLEHTITFKSNEFALKFLDILHEDLFCREMRRLHCIIRYLIDKSAEHINMPLFRTFVEGFQVISTLIASINVEYNRVLVEELVGM